VSVREILREEEVRGKGRGSRRIMCMLLFVNVEKHASDKLHWLGGLLLCDCECGLVDLS
jgi:hypothetical protein